MTVDEKRMLAERIRKFYKDKTWWVKDNYQEGKDNVEYQLFVPAPDDQQWTGEEGESYIIEVSLEKRTVRTWTFSNISGAQFLTTFENCELKFFDMLGFTIPKISALPDHYNQNVEDWIYDEEE